ncbi:MAG TPA: filamentous hemagglutinin N-terminal domain-containing protein, partial [Xanthobacteraceae bacterium]|nr:filamentous hemagglutinin N-terminal domain-containing protein [Xanthobacteraceae bacterium]
MTSRARNLLLATTALVPLGATLGATWAGANPLGAQVVGGSAAVQGQGTASVTVTQSSSKAIINWNTFNIAPNESTKFVQPDANAIALNKVVGNLGPSMIDGLLTANGKIFIVNGDGILFGPHAVVNVGSLLATTSDIKNADFMAGRYNFSIPGKPDASIVNLGNITAANGGFAALVAPGVRNSGTITATLGTVALAAGNVFNLDFYGDKLINLAVNDQIAATVKDVATGKPLDALVKNDGALRANGGRVELTAAAVRVVVDSVINTSGVIEANSIGVKNGVITLSAATGSSKPAGAPAQVVKVSGNLSAKGSKTGETGGKVTVTGEKIVVSGAQIDASGQNGGGTVLIGGDWSGGKPQIGLVNNPSAKLEAQAIPTATTVTVDAASKIDVSATGQGNGGKAIVWSDGTTTF